MQIQPSASKPQILHLVTDRKVGGIKTTLEVLLNSRLTDKFNFSVGLTQDFRTILNSYTPDVTVLHTACSWATLASLFPLRKFGKFVICEHHYDRNFSLNVKSLGRFHLMLRIFYGLADHVVAISKNQVEWMQQNKLVDPGKIALIHPTRLLDDFLVLPSLSDVPDRYLHLGTYGRFSADKGFDVLIEAMRLLSDLPIKLDIGGYGAEEDRLRALSSNLNNIGFVGLVQNIPEFLNRCDAVVIPSRHEPWGLICVEAKAAARPVIASAVGGLVEQLSDRGILVPSENPEALAAQIRNLNNLPRTSLRELGERNRESVIDDLERYLTQWDNLICTLLG